MFKSILASAVIAASTFLAPAAHALVTTCWWSNGTGTLEAQLCSINSRVNANDHLVYDLIDHAGNKGTLVFWKNDTAELIFNCLLYTSPSPRDRQKSRMPSSA